MSKGNLFLGFGRGKVGDVVFSRQNGEQVARARNRAPKNPQSPLQMVQRVIMKTTSTAYSLLQPICNHSFQGYAEGTPNQSRFAKVNNALMRRQLADIINSGDAEEILTSTEYNFASKYTSMAQIRAYQVSEGTLPPMNTLVNASGLSLLTPDFTLTAATTYAQVVDALGLKQGDQLTFVVMTVDDRADVETSEFNGMHYGRVILEPRSGDMSKPFLSSESTRLINVNDPNPSNEGDVRFLPADSQSAGSIGFMVDDLSTDSGSSRAIYAACVIVSRLVGGTWARSTEFLSLRSDPSALQNDHNIGYLYDAIYSFLSGASSSLYLNQAEGF